MSETMLSLATSPRADWQMSRRFWLLPLIGILMVAAGAMAPSPAFAAGAFAAGATLLVLSAIIRAAETWSARRRRRNFAAIAEFVRHDAVPCLLSDEAGALCLWNAAAERLYNAEAHETLAGALRSTLASPSAVLGRLSLKAQAAGAAREDVVTRKGNLRLSAQRIGPGALLWRVESFGDRAAAAGGGDTLGIPRLTAGRGGAILFMNDAARSLLGARVKSLSQIFDAPPVSGEVARVAAAEGSLDCLVAEGEGGGGRRDLYLFPAPARTDPVPASDRETIDRLPVALLKLGADGRVLAANGDAQRLLGSDPVPGTRLADLMEGLGRPLDTWLEEAVRGVVRSEFLRLTRRDQEVFVQVTLSAITERGASALLAVLHDATELKSLEAQFVQSQKMQAIGQLAGGVAHDFNNLLTAISGHCDLLLLRRDQGDPDYGDLVQIHQNANRAAALVGQLLAFSRKQTLRPERLDLRDTLADLTHLLNRLVGERVSLTLVHDPDLPPIRADKRQLEQVLMNLVVNARDAMPRGGEIRIETQRLHLADPWRRDRAEVPPGDYVAVRVTDEGVGIPPDKIGKVFEPFYTTKRTGEGTGLGLSTVYGIVKQTGGFVFVDSGPGEGATFTLLFPAPADAAEASPRDGAAPEAGRALAHREAVVLLVEDEVPVRAFASRALRLRGHTVLEAGSAEEALETLRGSDLDVDVFVTDVVMPGRDGPSWVREALRDHPGIRVVFVSGYAEESFGRESTDIPNAVFLPKPFSLDELTETVQRQLH
ncbi:ATP-binding protein [Rhodosalinus sp. FB01]|uniref:ATP-binding response regulator n=1 Tax=Rhodosalinus sp. FB01 TaxID=3239194 RepID=UPI00352544E1